jgi:tRNA(fMet)-specific endonuclease VapC
LAVRLLDTNIVSYIIKGHTLATRYQPHLVGHTLAVCAMTVAELRQWSLFHGWGPAKIATLDSILAIYLILNADRAVAEQWAAVRYARRAQPISVDDAWIAATALAYQIELVTHNARDFQNIPGLTIITEGP